MVSLIRFHMAVPGVLSLMGGAIVARPLEVLVGLDSSALAWLAHPALVTALAVTFFCPLYALWRRWIDARPAPACPPPAPEAVPSGAPEGGEVSGHRIVAA